MVTRKVWVKRPGASATLVTIHEDDLVDDVRDMIIRKYANSLGRSFDAPDVTLRIFPRKTPQPHHRGDTERTLGPEESISATLDAYYPRGQSVEEALLIDVPMKRTPKSSPRSSHHLTYYTSGEVRPVEGGTEYFPPMPVSIPSPHLPGTTSIVNGATLQNAHHPSIHSISVLNTGQIPTLPSPGTRAAQRHIQARPRMGRTHTTSPPILSQGQITSSDSTSTAPNPPPLPSPPALDPTAHPSHTIHRIATPPLPTSTSTTTAAHPPSSPRSRPRKPLGKTRSIARSFPRPIPAGVLDGAVPPINVLIVEDNIINLKLLEAFMKRLKVRWQTAMNGREAVNKWRTGGFHLVLMDIQLPVMNGLDATKEIRRLERVNEIGVFGGGGSVASSAAEDKAKAVDADDKLPNTILFKSPVIIVALTASSLQSDRHEALAAGCNDFLTKPVNFVWLERKVMEWGCMQALIDFDGWRKWKDFSQNASNAAGIATQGPKDVAAPGPAAKPKKEKLRLSGGNTVGVVGTDNQVSEGATGIAAGA